MLEKGMKSIIVYRFKGLKKNRSSYEIYFYNIVVFNLFKGYYLRYIYKD